MELITEYPGPRADDYANVLALNTAFIKATSALKGPQRGRLAAAPFLLFSLREDDLDWWQGALAEQSQPDLMEAGQLENAELQRVQTATLSFLWQLARRDSYSVRLICGATIAWCDLITELPLLVLLERVAARADLIQSRLTTSGELGQRLLNEGTSTSTRLRRSSQFTALHALLTRSSVEPYARLPSAACEMAGPMRVLEKKV